MVSVGGSGFGIDMLSGVEEAVDGGGGGYVGFPMSRWYICNMSSRVYAIVASLFSIVEFSLCWIWLSLANIALIVGSPLRG